jgi:hypothetical protein
MDSNIGKITVVAREGEALVGTSFIELLAGNSETYQTDNIHYFKDYLKGVVDAKIFFQDDKVVAMPNCPDDDHVYRPLAVCEICESPEIVHIKNHSNLKYTVDLMEGILTRVRDNLNSNGISVLEFCSNGVIRKIVSVERSRDNRGNINLNIKRESGQDDYQCPKTITFKVPVIQHLLDEFEFTFDMALGLKEAIIDLSFISLNFRNEVSKIKRNLIIRELSEIEIPKYWGELKTTRWTDEWRYKRNPL